AGAVRKLAHVVRDQVNVKSVEVEPASRVKEILVVRLKPVYQRLGPAFREKTGEVVKVLESMQDLAYAETLEREGELRVRVGGEEVSVKREMVEVLLEWRESFLGDRLGSSFIALDFRISEREMAEGFARDVLRRIQFMRKELNLPVDAYIVVKLYVPPEARALLTPDLLGYVKSETRAREVELVDSAEGVTGSAVREWEIGDLRVVIGVSLHARAS
ncbi:MAG: DUF5915 domain-containing protein, partial [Thermofilum sp.]|nr:DUF5915 domain-containing protein [Thermofilum sp.]